MFHKLTEDKGKKGHDGTDKYFQYSEVGLGNVCTQWDL